METNPVERAPDLTFRKILVPLDGSEMAERALVPAAAVARALGSSLRLVRVIQTSAWPGPRLGDIIAPHVITELLEDEEREAKGYLDGVVTRLRATVVAPVSTSIARGEPGAALMQVERDWPADLVVMATHARAGLERVALGSAADYILRKGEAPVLLVRAEGEERTSITLAHALVPLDGSLVAEAALRVLAPLAGALVQKVTFVRVVDPESSAGETAEAHQYLNGILEREGHTLFRRVPGITSTVLYGDAATQIVAYSKRAGCDVIAMATHGRGGLSRMALGSTADGVLRTAELPVLVARAPRMEA